ncbi:MAG: hypothetical protein J1F12_04135 [Muribaculaceae bacterium]|nr:hypothetical protein [Muribaculaceae bacterium]
MEEIGGYFELELPRMKEKFLHHECLALNSARNSLALVLSSNKNKIKKILIPDYTCPVVIEEVVKSGILYDFYKIGKNLEIDDSLKLEQGEWLIVNNFFGIKDHYISEITSTFPERVIVDDAQAWYAPNFDSAISIYSPRKFFGVPDGGFICGNINFDVQNLPEGEASDLSRHLLMRIDKSASEGYRVFRESSEKLGKEPIRKLSKLSRRILESIDMKEVKDIRKVNYIQLDQELYPYNQLKLPSRESFECPMVYPLFMPKGKQLKEYLIANKVYVASYWPGIEKWCKKGSMASEFSDNLVALPIDQRYGKGEMMKIINVVTEFLNGK